MSHRPNRLFAQLALAIVLIAGMHLMAPGSEGAPNAPTGTATATATRTATTMPTATRTATAMPAATRTSSFTPTFVPLAVATGTPTPTATPLPTLTLTPGATSTPLYSPTPAVASSPTPSMAPTPTLSATGTVTATTPVSTPTLTGTPTLTPGLAGTSTITLTAALTGTATITATRTATAPRVTPTPIALRGEYAPDEIIVKLTGAATRDRIDKLTAPFGGKNPKLLKGLNAWVLKVPPGKVGSILAALLQNPDVEYIEPNYILHIQGTPNDPDYVQQPYLANIQLPQAWDVTTGYTGTVVAVIDTGVDVNHPDLAAKIWKNPGETGLDANGKDKATNGVDDDADGYIDDVMGWNTVAGNNQVQDDHGHGTHVAGIVAADTNNGIGIAGISWGARIMPIKAMDQYGTGTFSQVSEAIIFASDHGARIINLSLGAPGTSQVLNNAITYAQTRGALVVAAAGDTGKAGVYYPAALPNVIAVGATDLNNQRATFSTTGDRLDLVAPGVDIYSTWLGGYTRLSGTSMSAAHVSGVAALLAGQKRFDTAAKIREALLGSALDLGPKGRDPSYGAGLVQALEALNYVPGVGRATPTPLPTVGPSPTPYGGKLGILATQDLFGTAMTQSGCTVTGTGAYTPQSFDGTTGRCLFTNAGNWTYSSIQTTAYTNIYSPTLTVRFHTSSWVNDQIIIEASNNSGASWSTVATFQTGAPPPTTLTYYTYTVSSIFTTAAQVNSARVRFRVALVSTLDTNLTIYSDQMALRVSDTLAPTPTPTPIGPVPTPTLVAPAPTKVPVAADPHVSYVAVADQCAACHRGHTASGMVLRKLWPEQNVCFDCHTTGGSGTNVQPAFTSYTNTTTRFFKHDTAATSGVHRDGENTGASFGGANRHVECEDCHEPHQATRTLATPAAPALPPEQKTVSGVDPVWNAVGAPASFTWMAQAQREYQTCFKCHSSYTTLPTYIPDGWNGTAYVANGLAKLTSTNTSQVLDSRDLAKEFNPYNGSFHPVTAQGRNQRIPAASWTAGSGMTQTSIIYCSDCHGNANSATQGVGPHGSPSQHILKESAQYKSVWNTAAAPATGQGCFNCHDYNVYVDTNRVNAAGTNFRQGTTNYHSVHTSIDRGLYAPCYSCHDTHGSEQQHLINFDTSAGSPTMTFGTGLNSQTAWTQSGTGGSCNLNCHGTGHNPLSYTGQ